MSDVTDGGGGVAGAGRGVGDKVSGQLRPAQGPPGRVPEEGMSLGRLRSRKLGLTLNVMGGAPLVVRG